ncbi:MAG: class II glutamine amidotransferase, partial [Mesorhizobium sp.]
CRPPSSFVTMTADGMGIRPFAPAANKLALVG